MAGMAQRHIGYSRIKRAIGFAVLAAAIAAAVATQVDLGGEVTAEGLASRTARLPGVREVIAFKFDNIDYNGQGAARVVAIDLLIDPTMPAKALEKMMHEAGGIARKAVEVYQKVVVTGYRTRSEQENGLPFSARAVWLAPELAAPMEGWSTIRLPDAQRQVGDALTGIYRKPAVTVRDGAVSATVDLYTEKIPRPTADAREIASLPFIDTFDWDNVFARSAGVSSVEVTVTDGGRTIAHASMTREGYTATDVPALRARFAADAIALSTREMVIADRYEKSKLYSPLVFDKVVTAEDKAEIAALRAERRAVEDAFYSGLFARGELAAEAPAKITPPVPIPWVESTES